MKKEPISEYGDVMSLEQWRGAVGCGCFIDYDGFGYYSDGIVMFIEHVALPSEVGTVTPPAETTHVVWFNR